MANYFRESLKPDSRKMAVEKAIRDLTGVKFDTIVCRGVSGAAIAPIVAYLMDKQIAFVRKAESTHSGSKLAGRVKGPYVIIDDFVDSGRTIEAIQEMVREYCREATCIGFWGYSVNHLDDGQENGGTIMGLPWLVKEESKSWIKEYREAADEYA